MTNCPADVSRFQQWLTACNNPRIQKMDPLAIHKRYRICRRHFDSDCLNGGCRRLLNTAVPSLYLRSPSNNIKAERNVIDSTADIVYVPVPIGDADSEEHFELVLTDDDKPIVTRNEVKCMRFSLFVSIEMFLN